MKRRFWLVAIVLMLVLSMSLMLLVACDGSDKKDDDEEEEERAPKLTEEEEIDLIVKSAKEAGDKANNDLTSGAIKEPQTLREFLDICSTYVCKALNNNLKKSHHIKSIVITGEEPVIELINADKKSIMLPIDEDSNAIFICQLIGTLKNTKSGWEFELDQERYELILKIEAEQEAISVILREADNFSYQIHHAIVTVEYDSQGEAFSLDAVMQEFNKATPEQKHINKIYCDFVGQEDIVITCVSDVRDTKRYPLGYIIVAGNLTDTSEIVPLEKDEGLIAMQKTVHKRYDNMGRVTRVVLTYENGAWTGNEILRPYNEQDEKAILTEVLNNTYDNMLLSFAETGFPMIVAKYREAIEQYIVSELNANIANPTFYKLIRSNEKTVYVAKSTSSTLEPLTEITRHFTSLYLDASIEIRATSQGWVLSIDEVDMQNKIDAIALDFAPRQMQNVNDALIDILGDIVGYGDPLTGEELAHRLSSRNPGYDFLNRVYVDFASDGTVTITSVSNYKTAKHNAPTYIIVQPNMTETSEIVILSSGEGMLAKRATTNIGKGTAGNIKRVVLDYTGDTWTSKEILA